MKRQWVISITVCAVVLLTLLATGCSQPSPEPAGEETVPPPEVTTKTEEHTRVLTPPTPPDYGMEVQLSLSDSPVLDKAVQVTFTIAMQEGYGLDASNTTARIILPGGFELVDGALEWQGDIIRGTSVEIKATIRAVEIGEYRIEARAGFSPYEGAYSVESDTLYVAVFTGRAFVSDKPIKFGGESYGVPRFILPPTDEMIMVIELSLSNAPSLGETAEVTLTATAIHEAPGAQVYFNLPEGFELVSGDWWWDGDLAKDAQVELKATVRSVKTGRWHISATGTYSPSETSRKVVYVDCLRIYVFEDSADILHIPPMRLEPQKDSATASDTMPAVITPEPLPPP